jgi:hypothetical protein
MEKNKHLQQHKTDQSSEEKIGTHMDLQEKYIENHHRNNQTFPYL